MPNKGRCITVDEYLIGHHSTTIVTLKDRIQFEGFVASQYALACDLIDLATHLVPDDLKESLLVNFTRQTHISAQAMGAPPHIAIDVSLGLIERLWRAAASLSQPDDMKRSVERLILTVVIGHELTHVFSGHNEGEADPDEGRSAEAHADFFSGLYVSRLTYSDKPNAHLEDLGKSLWITLSALILATLLNQKANDEYHSSSVRFLFIVAGHVRWLADQAPALLSSVEHYLKLDRMKEAIRLAVADTHLRDGMLRTVELALASDENVRDTIARAERFRPRWYRRAALLQPIIHLLDVHDEASNQSFINS